MVCLVGWFWVFVWLGFFVSIAHLKNHLFVSSCSFSVPMSKNGTSGPGFLIS